VQRAGSKQESKSGKILFAAALGNGLEGPISKAIAAAGFSQILFDRLRQAHSLGESTVKSCWLNVPQTACVWYEIGVE
jgi:hypothetical protein